MPCRRLRTENLLGDVSVLKKLSAVRMPMQVELQAFISSLREIRKATPATSSLREVRRATLGTSSPRVTSRATPVTSSPRVASRVMRSIR